MHYIILVLNKWFMYNMYTYGQTFRKASVSNSVGTRGITVQCECCLGADHFPTYLHLQENTSSIDEKTVKMSSL